MNTQESAVEMHFQSGAEKRDKGFYEESIVDFLQALSIDPNHIASLYQISYALCSLNRYEDALIYSDKIIALDHDWNSYMQRAAIKKAMGDIIGEEADRKTAWAIGKIACWG